MNSKILRAWVSAVPRWSLRALWALWYRMGVYQDLPSGGGMLRLLKAASMVWLSTAFGRFTEFQFFENLMIVVQFCMDPG